MSPTPAVGAFCPSLLPSELLTLFIYWASIGGCNCKRGFVVFQKFKNKNIETLENDLWSSAHLFYRVTDWNSPRRKHLPRTLSSRTRLCFVFFFSPSLAHFWGYIWGPSLLSRTTHLPQCGLRPCFFFLVSFLEIFLMSLCVWYCYFVKVLMSEKIHTYCKNKKRGRYGSESPSFLPAPGITC